MPVLKVFSRHQSSWIKTQLEKSDLFSRVSKGGSQESCNEAPPLIPGKVFLAQLLNTMPLLKSPLGIEVHKRVRIHLVSKYQILHCVFAYPALSGFSVEVAEYLLCSYSFLMSTSRRKLPKTQKHISKFPGFQWINEKGKV